MSTLATGAPGGMTYCIVDKIEATAKTAPKNISKLTNSQNLYRKVSFCTIKSVTLRQRGFSVSRSIVSQMADFVCGPLLKLQKVKDIKTCTIIKLF